MLGGRQAGRIVGNIATAAPERGSRTHQRARPAAAVRGQRARDAVGLLGPHVTLRESTVQPDAGRDGTRVDHDPVHTVRRVERVAAGDIGHRGANKHIVYAVGLSVAAVLIESYGHAGAADAVVDNAPVRVDILVDRAFEPLSGRQVLRKLGGYK